MWTDNSYQDIKYLVIIRSQPWLDVQIKSGQKACTFADKKTNQMTRATLLMIDNLVKDITAVEVLAKLE